MPLLLQYVLLEVCTQRDRTVAGLACLCMLEAEGEELLAHATLLAPSNMRHDPLHLNTSWALAVPVPALSSVHQDLDEALNGTVLCFLRVFRACFPV